LANQKQRRKSQFIISLHLCTRDCLSLENIRDAGQTMSATDFV
jgi:hypothetical protein